MPKRDDEFHLLMRKAMTGSAAAARELFDKYETVLLKAIRRKLSKNVRSKFDSGDFVQDVWASFFAEPARSRVFESPEHLVAFLTSLARNKVVDAVRQRLTLQKHNVLREQSLDDSRFIRKNDLMGGQPTPSQILMTKEEWSAFLRKQPLVYRRIFILLRDGHTHAQIAAELGINVRTVERVVAKIATGAQT